jgi:hypothetical protein
MGGQFTLQGQQLGTPGTATQPIGPFSVACSAVQYNAQEALNSGSNTITIPSGAAGFAVITPTGGTTAITYGGNNIAQAGLALVVVIDPANPITSFTLGAAGSVTVTVQAF